METGSLDPRLVQGIIRSLYRLFRVGTFHALDNQAIGLAVNATLEALRKLEQFESQGITLIFAEDTAIVNGQLLRATPEVYESAMDFAQFLERLGVNAISIDKGVEEAGLRKLLALFVDRENSAAHLDGDGYLSPHIRMRLVNPNLLLGLEDERLSQLERVLLTYALSVLVIRRLFASVAAGGFDLAGYFKRMARQLAMVNYTDRPVVFDVIMGRHLHPDTAKLAVNSAILAVAMTRRFTKHEATLSRVCMAALLLDVGRARPSALDAPDARVAMPLSTAIVHMAMGSLRGDSIDRAIITYEAQALLDGHPPHTIHSDGLMPTADAHIVAVARRFVELVTKSDDGTQLTPDGAMEWLHRHAPDDLAHYAVDLLTDAIGLIPRGTCVELDSGWRGVVARSGPNPSRYDRPTVLLVEDRRGNRIDTHTVDLAKDPDAAARHGKVSRVINRPGPVLASEQRQIAGPLFDWIGSRKASEERVLDWLRREAHWRATAEAEDRRHDGITGAQRVLEAAQAVSDARQRAMGWRAETDASEAVGGGTRTLSRSAASVEYERRRGREPSPGSDFASVGTGLKRVVEDSTGSGSGSGVGVRHASGIVRGLGTGGHRLPSASTSGLVPALEATTGSLPPVSGSFVAADTHESGSVSAATRSVSGGVHRVARGATTAPEDIVDPLAFDERDGSHARHFDVDEFDSEPSSAVRVVGSGVYRRPVTGTTETELLPGVEDRPTSAQHQAATSSPSGLSFATARERPSAAEPTNEQAAGAYRRVPPTTTPSDSGNEPSLAPRQPFDTPMAGTGILKRVKKRPGSNTDSGAGVRSQDQIMTREVPAVPPDEAEDFGRHEAVTPLHPKGPTE